jgi:hypothetical protein
MAAQAADHCTERSTDPEPCSRVCEFAPYRHSSTLSDQLFALDAAEVKKDVIDDNVKSLDGAVSEVLPTGQPVEAVGRPQPVV